jgi:hypothetical protein
MMKSDEMMVLYKTGFTLEDIAEIYFKVNGYEISERGLYLKIWRTEKEMQFRSNPVELNELASGIIQKYKIKEKLSV